MAEKGFEIIQFGNPIKGAEEGIDKAINETIAEIATQAKALAPVNKKKDGGRLRNSIMYKGPGLTGGFNDYPGVKANGSEKLKSVATDGVGYVGSNLDYATYQEFGTKDVPPQPFLRPATASVAGKNLEEIAKVMNAEMKKWTEDKAKRTKK